MKYWWGPEQTFRAASASQSISFALCDASFLMSGPLTSCLLCPFFAVASAGLEEVEPDAAAEIPGVSDFFCQDASFLGIALDLMFAGRVTVRMYHALTKALGDLLPDDGYSLVILRLRRSESCR